MKDTKKLLGAKLRALRKKRGLTQEDMADKIGVSLNFYGQLERGSRAPSIDTLDRLAEAFGLGISSLFSAENSPKAASSSNKKNNLDDKLNFIIRDASLKDKKLILNVARSIIKKK